MTTKKVLLALASASLLAFGSLSPVYAEDPPAADDGTTMDAPADPDSANTGDTGDMSDPGTDDSGGDAADSSDSSSGSGDQ